MVVNNVVSISQGKTHYSGFAISSKHFALFISFWNTIIYVAEVSLDSSPESQVTTNLLLWSNNMISELALLVFSAEVYFMSQWIPLKNH